MGTVAIRAVTELRQVKAQVWPIGSWRLLLRQDDKGILADLFSREEGDETPDGPLHGHPLRDASSDDVGVHAARPGNTVESAEVVEFSCALLLTFLESCLL